MLDVSICESSETGATRFKRSCYFKKNTSSRAGGESGWIRSSKGVHNRQRRYNISTESLRMECSLVTLGQLVMKE